MAKMPFATNRSVCKKVFFTLKKRPKASFQDQEENSNLIADGDQLQLPHYRVFEREIRAGKGGEKRLISDR